MSTNTSIGRGPASGGNENHDGDPANKTLGEKVGQERPAGSEPVVDGPPMDSTPGLEEGTGYPRKPG